jgi:2-C-methyl-D-erythritol 4-phosphate cytidylyltransferase/2-C-methyl-D-erythritol 2,4-cyclodiphosphate synthase
MIPKTCAIIPAAGRGLRMGRGRPKQFLEVSGKSLLAYTLDTFSRASFLSDIFLVVPGDFLGEAQELVQGCSYSEAGGPSFSVVAGGGERQDSVYNGLCRLPSDCRWVMVHDGVRPFASLGLLEESWRAALKTGAAIAALPATDTVKRVQSACVQETLARDEIWLVQTPQVFRKEILLQAYEEAREKGWRGTDDASFVERLGISVSVIQGERSNIKVTTPEDLNWAEWWLMRVGFGYDVHAFVEGRPLFLGGVEIPYTRGLLGHSDADVLLHAIADALLGAAALGDIGRYFPDSDPAYRGISSLLLLQRSVDLVRKEGFSVHNIDSTLVLQKPRLAPYISKMVEEIARIVDLPISAVNVKATTTEKLGFTGREEGVAAYAVALLEEIA